ncbi:FAD-dependent monooxygenase [Streptomyces sp. NPDC005408]|uniref:FAD-dependent monooxygenase n=1 Tax=Streptomyces sp. NPDC005408 TaxID=3155341 RepID=UPI0033BAFFC3
MAPFNLSDLTALLRACAGEEEGTDLDEGVLDVPFFDLGYDSLAILQTTARIEEELGLTLDEEAIDGADTPRQYLDLVNRALAGRGTDTLHTDAVVVGAGPAGLALTLMLLRSGVRVALVERSPSTGREFHGEILQPGGQRILDQLGVLEAARGRGAVALEGFQVLERDKLLLDIDYRRLEAPYNRLLALPQRHLLDELLARCLQLPGFHYLGGHRISSLLEADGDGPGPGGCAGAVVSGPGGRRTTVAAQVVVGCDGRFSKTRQLAGIAAGRTEIFDQDVVWFALPAPGRATGRVRVHRAGPTAVLVHDSWPDRLRIGWTLPHHSWQQAAARGIDDIRRELAAALPHLADLVGDHLTQLSDLTLLDVFAARADQWVRDGLVLAGDSAHTHGPLGAQGINLALQDAAVLHPLLVAALAAGDCSQGRLAVFEEVRAPAADAVLRMQRMQAAAFFGHGGPVAAFLRARAARIVTRTPLGARITGRIAYGHPQVHVRTDLFGADGNRPAAQSSSSMS